MEIACDVKPDQATLVPERREEVTTEGGLDVGGHREAVAAAVERLREAGISVSLFLDPDPRQIEVAKRSGADAVELHTGQYALAASGKAARRELDKLAAAGKQIVAMRPDAARRPRPDLSQRRPDRRDRGACTS